MIRESAGGGDIAMGACSASSSLRAAPLSSVALRQAKSEIIELGKKRRLVEVVGKEKKRNVLR